jgi:branched-chain amino acid transport system permease protein
MHVMMKRSYNQDIRLFAHAGQGFWYTLLAAAVLVAPAVLNEYYLSQFTFVAIYSIAGVGLMLLAGYTGQISLGHAAFLAAGAYAEAILQARGMPFALSFLVAGAIAGLLGVVVGLSAARLSGIYLAIATLAFAFIVEEVLARWESVTRGNSGIAVGDLAIGPVAIDAEWKFYYLCVGLLVLVMLGAINLLRSRTGRAFVAIRDSEIAARSLGINLARYKTIAFAASATLTGLAGALYSHRILFVSPDQFSILVSVELLVLVVVGGLGSLHGAVFGAVFVVMLPQAIALAKAVSGLGAASQAGLNAGLYGLMLVLFMLFEPHGLYGRWLKIKLYLDIFPFYRKATFKRQRVFQKSERLK